MEAAGGRGEETIHNRITLKNYGKVVIIFNLDSLVDKVFIIITLEENLSIATFCSSNLTIVTHGKEMH